MKITRNFLSLVVLILSIQGIVAQEDIAMAAPTITGENVMPASELKTVIDQTGIVEISKLLTEQVKYPYEAFAYANELNVRVQISLNKEGKIIDKRIVASSNRLLDNEILEILGHTGTFTPIRINGKAKTQTFQIPLKFKK